MKKEKGITLIALIITIVVMLILVAVTLTIALGENGIIAKTQYAKQQQAEKLAKDKVQSCLEFDSTGQVNFTDTEGSLQRTGATVKSKTETEITVEMDGYTFTISKNGNISTSENGNSTGETVGSINIPENVQVGDIIEYDCITGVDQNLLTYTSEQSRSGHYEDQTFTVTENPEWVVLEKNANEILITPRNPVQTLTLHGQDGYTSGPAEIEAICEMYGHGEGAINARSITIEDVNRISGYTPEEPSSHTFKKEENGYISYNGRKRYNYTTFNYYDNGWKSLTTGESVTLQDTSFFHDLGTTKAETILKKYSYWISSRCVSCDSQRICLLLPRQ